MGKLGDAVPYVPFMASSSSSDAGIREENGRGSNINLVSSSTLNDRGMSLHSFPVESEIFMENSPLSMQTFVNDSFSSMGCGVKREMVVENFFMDIPESYKKGVLVVERFGMEVEPISVELSSFSTILSDIPSEKKYSESRETETIHKELSLSIENVSNLTISNSTLMSTETFSQEISPINKYVSSSQNLKKLEEQMTSLRNVFDKVRVFRERSTTNTQKERSQIGFVDIKQLIDNAETQTDSATSQNTDICISRIDALNLECDFVRAAVDMIKKYPFYYDFLERCYSGRKFEFDEEFQHLKPKQKCFKKAVLYASGYNAEHLEVINSVLLEFFDIEKCFCLK